MYKIERGEREQNRSAYPNMRGINLRAEGESCLTLKLT